MKTLYIKDKWIDDFFKDDYLDFTKYPDVVISDYFKKPNRKNVIDFTSFKSKGLADEIKVILKMAFTGFKGFTYKSEIVNELFNFSVFMKDNTANSFFEIDKKKLKEDYLRYRKVSYTRRIDQLIPNVYLFLTEHNDKRTGLDRDIWYLDKLKIAEERLNYSQTIKTVNFSDIKNNGNKELIKKFMRYQLGSTELSVSTIMNRIRYLRIMSNYIEKDFKDYTLQTVHDYAKYIKGLDYSNNEKSKLINMGRVLFDYLKAHELYEGVNPFAEVSTFREKKNVQTSIPDYVIQQVFYNLDMAPFEISVMFVLNYCTGMRISDLCQLEVGCLFEAKGHYFIKHKVQKMKKYQANIIPKAAYELVKQQELIVKKDNPDGKYLFSSRSDKNRPMTTRYYSEAMKKFCKEWDIKNEDGTPYEFRSHAYRHTIATTLLNDYNVDLSIIQLGVLGHTEINMSLCYAERSQSYRERFEKNYVSIDGSIKRLSDETDELFLGTVDKLAKSLDNMQLPNGMCMYPRKLGICPHFDVCLQCEYFRTSLDYLELHKQQLAVVNRNIPIYEANGWLPNLATAKKEKEGLERIIAALELLKEGGAGDGSNTA